MGEKRRCVRAARTTVGRGAVVLLAACGLAAGPLVRSAWADAPLATISTFAGTGVAGYSGDGGPAVGAQINGPQGLAVDAAGNVFVADNGSARVRRVAPTGTITTVAGTGTPGFSGDGGAATGAQLSGDIKGLAVDTAGNLFIVDSQNNRIRKVTPGGTITTVAGSGRSGFGGDGGPATLAALQTPTSVALGGDGTLYVMDYTRLRMVSPAGTITTVAGDGTFTVAGEGIPAATAPVGISFGVALDNAGNVYFSELMNRRVRKIDGSGIVTTVAGNSVQGSGDGGPATSASLSGPSGLTFDTDDNLYIADGFAARVRKVDRFGLIWTAAGNGQPGSAGDGGAAIEAQLSSPRAVSVDPARNLYVAEAGGHRVRRVNLPGAGTYEDANSSLSLTGRWVPVANAADSGGGARISGVKGAAAELTFAGTGVSWIAHRQADAGVSDVYLDGAKVASVDLFSATKLYQQTVFSTSGLPSGPHTIRVARTGTRNPASTGTLHSIDAFVVTAGDPPAAGTYQESSPHLVFAGTWTTTPNPGDNGGAAASSTSANASVDLTFRGTSIRWQSHRQPDGGIGAVFIDGVKVGTIDLYAASTVLKQTVYAKHDLAPGTHTIRVARTGNKNASSSGTILVLDAFVAV
jgi:sugar lactone lactonase YvrE